MTPCEAAEGPARNRGTPRSMTGSMFSIVVPTYDRPKSLRRCLTALAGLDYPASRYEVVIVDDGGPVEVDRVIRGLALTIRVVKQPRRGPAAARNAGARHAEGDMLAFTDDDCAPHRAWLRTFAAKLAPDSAVGGRLVDAGSGGVYTAATQTIIDLLYAHYNAAPNAARFVVTANLAVPAADFRSVGGFDEQFNTSEDREFCRRWLQGGKRVVYAPDAVVAHAPTTGFGAFCRRHFGYGRGAYRFHSGRGGTVARSLTQEKEFYKRVPSLLLSELQGRPIDESLRIAALLGLWQAANAAGFAAEALAARSR